MKSRILPSIPQSLTVFAFWLLMAESYNVSTVIMGLMLAWAMPLLASRLEREFATLGKLRHLPRLVLLMLWDILRANLTVARELFGRQSAIKSDFIWVPLDLTNIHGIAFLTSLITLTPGTVSAALSSDRKHLLVHCLNVSDPQAMIDEIKQRYEAPLREVFP